MCVCCVIHVLVDIDSGPAEVRVHSYEQDDVKSAFKYLFDILCIILKDEKFERLQRECILYVTRLAGKSFSRYFEKTCNVKELLNKLLGLPYCIFNWIDIRILENVSSGIDAAVEQIKKYKKGIFTKKLDLSHIAVYEVDENCFIKVEEKWKRSIDNVVIQDIIDHWDGIEKVLIVPLLLHSITVPTKNIIEIVWLLRRDLHQNATNMAKNNVFGDQLPHEVFYFKIYKNLVKDLNPGRLLCFLCCTTVQYQYTYVHVV